ncbi:tumor necrosis factor receptor superfamily member 6 [Polymixia lowei]
MAYYSRILPKWSIVLFFFLFYMSWAYSSLSPKATVKDNQYRPYQSRTISRIKRQLDCQDGSYEHEGNTCCLCAIGQRLKEHCSGHPKNQKTSCELCESGKTYNSRPNSLPSCQPCTSCSHPSANLEEEEPCTTGKDSVCRCKPGHYCESDRKPCTFCQPCKKCDMEGEKTPCTATNDTVCNDKGTDGQNGQQKVLLSVLIPLLLVCVLVPPFVTLYICRKKKCFVFSVQSGSDAIERGRQDEEIPLQVSGVDIMSHLPAIAKAVGWKAMRDVAMQSDMHSAIESQTTNHPNDAEERTIQLLQDWVQKQGKKAPTELIQALKKMDRNDTAEKVVLIINNNST